MAGPAEPAARAPHALRAGETQSWRNGFNRARRGAAPGTARPPGPRPCPLLPRTAQPQPPAAPPERPEEAPLPSRQAGWATVSPRLAECAKEIGRGEDSSHTCAEGSRPSPHAHETQQNRPRSGRTLKQISANLKEWDNNRTSDRRRLAAERPGRPPGVGKTSRTSQGTDARQEKPQGMPQATPELDSNENSRRNAAGRAPGSTPSARGPRNEGEDGAGGRTVSPRG